MFYKLVISKKLPCKTFSSPFKVYSHKMQHKTKCFFPNKVLSQTEFSRNKVNLPPQTKTCCFLWQQQQKQQVRPLCEAAEQSREQLPAFALFHSFHPLVWGSFKRSLRIWGIPSFWVFWPDFIGGLKIYADFYRKHAKLRTCLRNHSWMLGVHKKTNKRLPLLPGPPINQSIDAALVHICAHLCLF